MVHGADLLAVGGEHSDALVEDQVGDREAFVHRFTIHARGASPAPARESYVAAFLRKW